MVVSRTPPIWAFAVVAILGLICVSGIFSYSPEQNPSRKGTGLWIGALGGIAVSAAFLAVIRPVAQLFGQWSLLSDGMACLGRIFQNGLGVQRQPDLAFKWFHHRADAGDGPSARELADMYWNGEAVKADRVTAYMWSLIAFSNGAANGQSVVESFHRQMSDKEIERARKNALAYVRDHRMGIRLREPASVAKTPGNTP